MIWAVVAALASAALFAGGTAMQHRAAGTPAQPRSDVHMLARLARRPGWWLGLGLSALAFGLHALALHWGALSLVQPVIVSGIVFAVLLRALLDHRAPTRQDVLWSAVTWAGLALFISVLHHGRPHPPHLGTAAWFVLGGSVLVAATATAANRTRLPERRGLLLGGSAGVLFGLVAGLVKLVIALAEPEGLTVLGTWPLWAMLAVGAWALTLSQRAYHAAPLSVSMPLLNIFDVMTAVLFGALVFGEHVLASPLTVLVELVGLAVMAVGVRRLAAAADIPETALSEPAVSSGARRS